MTPDNELLRRFAEANSEESFAELVQRHLNLVYSAAMRQANGDAHLAQDIAQIVFTDLARKAASLSRREVLTGWLYTSTHFAATKAMRAEGRRRAREQEAHAMRELLHEPASDVDWNQLRSVLDEVMHQLKDSDREAILWRYFEKRPLAEIGAKLGVNENTARMRVERALEKLRAQLIRRGVTTTAAALSTAITVNAVQIAPAGLAVTLTNASLATAAAGTATTFAILKFMAMTKLKLGIVGAVIVAGVATPLVLQHQAKIKLREENQSLRQQVERLSPLQAENERLSNLIGRANNSPSLSSDERSELLKLRGEITALRRDSQNLARLKADPTGVAGRAAKIKERLEQMPEKKIPELQFLTDQEWQQVASIPDKLETESDYRVAFSRARQRAKDLFARWLGQALHNYAKANNGMLPTDLSLLKPYFTPPVHDTNWKPGDPVRYELLAVDDAVLQRYQLVQTGKLNEVPQVETYPPVVITGNPEQDARTAAQREKTKTILPWTEPVVVEKTPVDDQFDSLFTVTVYGYSYKNFGRGTGGGSGTFAKTQLSPDGQPILVDPVPAVGRSWSGGGSFGGGSGGSGGGGALRPMEGDQPGDRDN